MVSLYTQLAIIVLCIAEAWLEVIVIRLKNEQALDYAVLNKKEHRRSAVYYGALVAVLTVLTWEDVDHHVWLVIGCLLHRRIWFEYALKLFRPGKKIRDIEGDQFWDNLSRSLFGKAGGYWELLVLLAGVGAINKLFLLNLHG